MSDVKYIIPPKHILEQIKKELQLPNEIGVIDFSFKEGYPAWLKSRYINTYAKNSEDKKGVIPISKKYIEGDYTIIRYIFEK